MKTLIVLVMGTLSLAAKPAAQDEKTCQDACNIMYTRPWRECNHVSACETYVEHEAKRCILKCKGQNE
jgi:hypothetical protein